MNYRRPAALLLAVGVSLTALAAPAAATPSTTAGTAGAGNAYYFSDTFSAKAGTVFGYGAAADTVFVGDWDGDGVDTLAYRRGAVLSVRNTNTTGKPDHAFSYGSSGDEILVGDWDGDGVDTLAYRRGAVFSVRNTNTSGEPDRVFAYGRPGDTVLVGDWDGDGVDTLAVRRGAEYFVKNTVTSGVADKVARYGRPGDDVYVGDFDGDRRESFTVRRGFTYFVANAIRPGNADREVNYGRADDVTLVGDWDGDGVDSLGIRRNDPSVAPELSSWSAAIDATYRAPGASPAGSAALTWARSQLGVPYKYGAAGPDSYDCSGLTMRAFEAAGRSLPRTTRDQWARTERVALDDLQKGDLVFWSRNGEPSGIYHVAIYAGNGMRLHAPSPGKKVELVRMYDVGLLPYGGRVR